MKKVLEICCDSLESSIVAEQNGADRIELCDNLYQGGITPSPGKIQAVLDHVSIPVNVLIRPRKGDFHYNKHEIETMIRDIRFLGKLRANGIVIGCLNIDGSLDTNLCSWLIQEAGELDVTFHRAFDMTSDPEKTINSLLELGVSRVLTSGQESTAVEGFENIGKFVDWAGEGLSIMACGNLLPENITPLLELPGLNEFHSAARKTVRSAMDFRGRTTMGDEEVSKEFEWHEVDGNCVKELAQMIHSRSF